MVIHGRSDMAISLFMAWCSYARTNQLLPLQTQFLLEARAGQRSLLRFVESGGRGYIHKDERARGRSTTSPEYARAFSQACQTLKIHVMPHQTRYSAASSDRARNVRSLVEIKKKEERGKQTSQ